MAENETITLSKDHVYGIVIIALVSLLTISVFTSGFGIVPAKGISTGTSCNTGGNGGTNGTGGTGSTGGTAAGAGLATLSVTPGTNPVLGQDSAPVTWIEFSDYQCPYCEMLYTKTDTQIKANYVDTGKMKMYFREVPLSFHDKANDAAMAGRCAGEQGKFWEMHDALFANQESWSGLPETGFLSTAQQYASTVGLDSTQFTSCMTSDKYAAEIAASESYAGSLTSIDNGPGYPTGIRGTPGIVLQMPKSKTDLSALQTIVTAQNMKLYQDTDNYVVFVPGAYPYSAFAAVLNTVTY